MVEQVALGISPSTRAIIKLKRAIEINYSGAPNLMILMTANRVLDQGRACFISKWHGQTNYHPPVLSPTTPVQVAAHVLGTAGCEKVSMGPCPSKIGTCAFWVVWLCPEGLAQMLGPLISSDFHWWHLLVDLKRYNTFPPLCGARHLKSLPHH